MPKTIYVVEWDSYDANSQPCVKRLAFSHKYDAGMAMAELDESDNVRIRPVEFHERDE